MRTVVVASYNEHKVHELSILLSSLAVKLVSLNSYSVQPVVETGSTFLENALLKAHHATQSTQAPAIADDSGLMVDLLDGEPGIYSARYAGESATDEENVQCLLDRVLEIRTNNSPVTACFHCVLVFMENTTDPDPVIASGQWSGQIVDTPRGDQGFGYDPIFQPLGLCHTAAELEPGRKNQISHRGQAAQQLVDLLRNRFVK